MHAALLRYDIYYMRTGIWHRILHLGWPLYAENVSSVTLSSAQFSLRWYPHRSAKPMCTLVRPSVFPGAVFETVLMFVWLPTVALSRPFKKASSFYASLFQATGASSSWTLVHLAEHFLPGLYQGWGAWGTTCSHGLCACRWCLKLLNTADVPRRMQLVMDAFSTSLSAPSFP